MEFESDPRRTERIVEDLRFCRLFPGHSHIRSETNKILAECQPQYPVRYERAHVKHVARTRPVHDTKEIAHLYIPR